jgi:hypothetical protein
MPTAPSLGSSQSSKHSTYEARRAPGVLAIAIDYAQEYDAEERRNISHFHGL